MISASPEPAGRSIRLVEVPFNSAGLTTGVARMPAALREAGLHDTLRADGPLTVEFVAVEGMVPERGPSGLLAEEALTRMVHGVAAAARQAWSEDAVPLVVAGDCPALLGGLIGLADRGGGGLVFVDGHEDAWPAGLGTTGEASDSEIALALGLYPSPSGLAGALPALCPANVLMLGPRDLDEITTEGATSIGDQVCLRDGAWLEQADLDDELPALLDQSAGSAPAGWWFHVDLDVLCSEALPAADYLQSGGISWARLDEVTAAVLACPGCCGASVVIYNPDLDDGAAAPRINRYLADTARHLRSRVRGT